MPSRRELIAQFIPASMNVYYVTAARGVDLTARAVVARRGRSLVFAEVRVTDPSASLVATGSVVQRLG